MVIQREGYTTENYKEWKCYWAEKDKWKVNGKKKLVERESDGNDTW